MRPYLGAPMNRFPPNCGCGCFSSCSTDTWYAKRWNAKKKKEVSCDVIASALHSLFDLKLAVTMPGEGGTQIGKGYGDVLRSWPPFLQASRCSLAYQFTVNAPLLWPPFSILRIFFCIFSHILEKILAL